MLHPGHPLFSLQSRAALETGFPTLFVRASSEREATDALSALQEVLGPLPQADLGEPFDPAEDGPDGAFWELRVDLPALDGASWERARAALAARGLPAAVLVPGGSPGARQAEDCGQRAIQTIDAGDAFACMPWETDGGEPVVPDLEAGEPGEDLWPLQAEILAAIRDAALPIPPEGLRGPETLDAVRHRPTGRNGLRISFSGEALDALDAEDLVTFRARVVGALAAVVRARADGPAPILAPDLAWDARWGFGCTLWIVGPPARALPGDGLVGEGLTPGPEALDACLRGIDGLAEEVELQVVPRSAADHDAVVDAVVRVLDGAGAPAVGGLPRWLRRSDPGAAGGARPGGPASSWAFAPCWRWTGPLGDPRPLVALSECLAALDRVAAVRVVPGEPVGLGETWPRMDPSWRIAAERIWVRLRDGLTDRDRMPVVAPSDDAGRASLRAEGSIEAAVAACGLAARAVADATGRRGWEVRLPEEADREDVLAAHLAALGAIRNPALASVGHFGYAGAACSAVLWERKEPSSGLNTS